MNLRKVDINMQLTIRTAAKAGVAVLVGAIALVSMTTAASAEHKNGGAATIINRATGQPINSFGSQTPFSFKLPNEAACSGDTAADNFHIFSYIADATAYPDPGNLAYTPDGPIPVGDGVVFTLYQTTGSPYVNKTAAPISGFIQNLPDFNFNLYSIDGRITDTAPDGTFVLPAGTYNIGLACANPDGTTDKIFNAQVIVSPSNTDTNGLTFEVVPVPQVPDTPLTVLLPLSAAALGGAAFVTMRRRRSSSTVAAG